MKLYSITILYKNPNSSTAIILKSFSDVNSFSFFQRRTVGEFMQFTAKIIAERSATSSRSSVKENDYLIHCFVRQDNLVAVCITDEEYQARVAFSMLNKVLIDFEEKINKSLWSTILNEKDCNYNKLPEFITRWQNPREADPLTRVQDEVEETKIVLHNTVQSVLDRGEKLDDLIRVSENLSDQSKMFYTQVRKMNKCCTWA